MVTFRFLMGICGNATALFLFLAPSVTMRRIIKSKSTEQFSCIPYTMALLNCLLFTWYGLPFITRDNLLLSTISGTGAVLEFTYLLVFIVYSPKMEKAKISVLLLFVVSVITTIALVSVFTMKSRKLLCGLAAAMFCTLRHCLSWLVIKTKSVEYMPFCLSMFVFLNSTSWFIYGLLGSDPFVYVPNALGTLLGMMQLILYAIYCDKPMKSRKAMDDGSAIEIDPEKFSQKKHQEYST